MAIELRLAFLIQFSKSSQSQTQFVVFSPNSELMWNKKQMSEDDDDSWEVRAFEEDTTGNLLGCTWPPRSYLCTFCRREFRSAQALGGHMNVHRRDRARLHAVPPVPPSPTDAKAPSSALLIPTAQEFVANGLCLLYPLPNPNAILIPTPPMDLPSSLLPISPFTTNKPNDTPLTAANSVVSSLCHSSNTEPSASVSNDNNHVSDENAKDSAIEVLDLELRLGRRPTPPP
ncbi:hypothetical protein Pfo_010082 [Paulownia fortunei]|nr:hypothetical protein Pfo_010082 [Paulownia fortunei]